MASKPNKEKKDLKKSAPEPSTEQPGKGSSKPKKKTEDDDEEDDIDLDTPKPTSKKETKSSPKAKKQDDEGEDDDDEVDDGVDEVDEWDKVEEEENWDPDFDEFDIPKSKTKKATGTKKGAKGAAEEEDLGLDEEFKDLDLFNDSGFDDEEDDF